MHTLIDYIFLDINRFSTTTNGMSDHNAQLVSISNLALPCIKHLPQCRRIIDEYSICKFTALLSHESWDAIFQMIILILSLTSSLIPLLKSFRHVSHWRFLLIVKHGSRRALELHVRTRENYIIFTDTIMILALNSIIKSTVRL